MQQVRMLSLSAGPDGVRNVNSVHAVSDDEADELIAGGYAEPFKGGPVPASSGVPKAAADGALTETATAGPQARPKPQSRGKKGK